MLTLPTIARYLALALLCVACAEDEEIDRRRLASSDSATGSSRDSLSDSSSTSTQRPLTKPQPFDSSYEYYIRTVPEDELDSIPMPKTPG